MRASMGRGVGREGGDKALAANTYPNDECRSNYYCGRKRHSKLGPEARRGPSPGSSVGSSVEIYPLWTILAEIHRLASHCLYENFTEVYEKCMKTSREGKREKTMIETRRGREREAEEEAEVRKQGGIGGGRS